MASAASVWIRPLLPVLFTILPTLNPSAEAQALRGTTKGDLQSNLSILNLFGEQPEAVQHLYGAAYPGSLLGDQQMEWLKEQLLDCEGPFIIMSCGTMWSDYVSKGKDSWGRWDPEGRERLFHLIEKHRIGGVLLISGDRHGARGFRIPRPSGFEFYEFEAGSLGGRKGPAAQRPEWTTQLYGVSNKYAFGEFTVDATRSDPEVTFRLIQDDGTEIYRLTLARSQLTPGP